MTEPLPRLGHVDPVGRPDPAPTPQPAAGSPEFQRILERLEQLARESAKPAPADAEALRDDLRAADDDFAAAMELRRKLEAAFRARQP